MTSHRHTHDWTPATNDQTGHVDWWGCVDCEATSPTCIVTDTRRRAHPTGTSMGICDGCLRVEGYVLDDITDALTWWDERDRNPGRSPMAFQLVRAHGGTREGDRLQAPEDVRAELLAWAVRWAAHTGAMSAEHDSPQDYLKSRHMWAAHNPAQARWQEYRDEVRKLRAASRRIVGLTPDRHPEACMHCGGRIVQDRADHRWQPRPDGRDDTVRCTGCGLTWGDRDAFQRNVRHHIWALPHDHPDRLVTIDQARDIFPDVPAGTFRYWLSEDRKADVRRLPERDWQRDGTPLYRLGDLHAKVQRRADDTRRGRPAQVIAR